MKPATAIFMLALAAATSSAASAADAESSAPNLPTFVNDAAQAGMTEVEVGKLALSKSKDPAIRGFAQRMVDDHTKANAELAAMAEAKGVTPPAKLDAEHQAMVASLKSKAEPDFDREYSRHMNMDHSKALALFEGATQSSDADVASFAMKTLPTLKEHKKMAEKLPGASKAGSPPAG
jgi:putative membrane protein